jgi:hypothetical protein
MLPQFEMHIMNTLHCWTFTEHFISGSVFQKIMVSVATEKKIDIFLRGQGIFVGD